VIELVTRVSLGLRPSLHAAARTMGTLPVSLAALYDKVNRTEPGILRALVRGSAERLAPVAAAVDGGTILPGWRLRVLDGNHLPASEKRLAPLRGYRGAALPGQTLVVYDPDSGLVTDLVAGEDAHQSERVLVGPLLASAQPGQLWIGDRHFCTRVVMGGLDESGAGFIVREHAHHPRLAGQGAWRECGRTEMGQLREQLIEVAGVPAPLSASLTSLRGIASRWRRIELALDTPTEAGERVISPARLRAGRLWSNLPEEIGAQRIATLYRERWRVEGMFQRLESVLNSEIRSLGHPRAALLGFTAAVLAYNILALLQRCVEQAHRKQEPPPEVSTYHLALHIRSGYEGMLIALPPEQWRSYDGDPTALADRLLQLARNVDPRQVATSKRGPKVAKPKGYVDAATARAHVATARVLAQARAATP
jgi:IS4 transposase